MCSSRHYGRRVWPVQPHNASTASPSLYVSPSSSLRHFPKCYQSIRGCDWRCKVTSYDLVYNCVVQCEPVDIMVQTIVAQSMFLREWHSLRRKDILELVWICVVDATLFKVRLACAWANSFSPSFLASTVCLHAVKYFLTIFSNLYISQE